MLKKEDSNEKIDNFIVSCRLLYIHCITGEFLCDESLTKAGNFGAAGMC